MISELTALREAVQRKPETSTTKPPKESTATPTDPSAKRDAKPPATETETKPPPPKKSKSTRSGPWDDPKVRSELEACRPRILELLKTEKQITKQGCADALGIDPTLAGRTLSYMMTQTNEITMISPKKTPDDPDPKKIFRRIP